MGATVLESDTNLCYFLRGRNDLLRKDLISCRLLLTELAMPLHDSLYMKALLSQGFLETWVPATHSWEDYSQIMVSFYAV